MNQVSLNFIARINGDYGGLRSEIEQLVNQRKKTESELLKIHMKGHLTVGFLNNVGLKKS